MGHTPLQQRLNQLNILKWCFLSISFLDVFILILFNVAYFSFQNITSSKTPPIHFSPEELKSLSDFFSITFYPVNLLGLIHIPLSLFSFIKFHQKKWHLLLLVNAWISLLIFPLGSFMGVTLFVFLYYADGKSLLQKKESQ